MPTSWTEKDVMEHAKKLQSPFEKQQQTRISSPGGVLESIRARGNGNLRRPLERSAPTKEL